MTLEKDLDDDDGDDESNLQMTDMTFFKSIKTEKISFFLSEIEQINQRTNCKDWLDIPCSSLYLGENQTSIYEDQRKICNWLKYKSFLFPVKHNLK